MTNIKPILLVEDNPQDEMLILRALYKINLANQVDVVRDRLRNYESGANSFVRKPLAFAEFAETAARMGVYGVALNEPPGG